jgi:hypothetical protein
VIGEWRVDGAPLGVDVARLRHEHGKRQALSQAV